MMDIVEISYIDTDELDGYIHEILKRWERAKSTGQGEIRIPARKVWRDESNTKAAYFCSFNYYAQYSGLTVMIYVDYDEVDMIGTIEIEYLGSFSHTAKEELVGIVNEVIGTFDPSIAPLPYGVKCPHCQARYVYRKRTGVVDCQNCAKSFDLELQEKARLEATEFVNGSIKESQPRLVGVDRGKISRCKWCGSIESSQWFYSGFNDAYCSRDCYNADRVEINGILGFSFAIALPLLLITAMISLGPIPELVILIFCSWLLSICSIYSYKSGRKVRQDVLKSSRQP